MNTRKGFTLVELLVVIAILAILATVSVVGYTSYIEGAEETAAQTEAASIHDAITVALVQDKNIKLEKTAAVANDPDTPADETAVATYIYITRDGNGYTVSEEAAENVTYADVPNISTDLTHRLSVVGGVLKYTSDKNVTVDVK